MKTLALIVFIGVAAARADCPVVVKCSIDGEGMMQEQCYINGSHKSCKFSHDYYGPNGKEHHYVIVVCY